MMITPLLSYLLVLIFFNAIHASSTTAHYSTRLYFNKRHGYQSEPTLALKSKLRTKLRTKSACRIFVWDALSAFRYHLCNHLLKDAVYEGLGGKKV